MIQINNGYKDYYYLQEDGNIYNASNGNIIKPNEKHLYRLKQIDDTYKKVSVKTLYKTIYNKPFCEDNIEDLEGEQWKEIAGTEGYYLISNKGRIKSLQNYYAIILKPYYNQAGYQRVDIWQNGRRQNKLVHKLTAAAWLPMPPQMDYQLHHKNFQKDDNAAENLIYLLAADHIKIHSERNKKEYAEQQGSEPKRDNGCQRTDKQIE